MMTTNNLGLYIHIPFCLRKCPYCGFYSQGVSENCLINSDVASGGNIFGNFDRYFDRFRDALIADIRSTEVNKIVDSIFFGGGTPTLLPEETLIAILNAIKESFTVSVDSEITIEANPGTVNVGKLTALHNAGFNRLSIGVQSFDDRVLKTLERIHNCREAEGAINDARAAGFRNVNIDLMFGIPGQTMDQWRDTLETALSLKPEHISFYSLQMEEGTPFMAAFERGEFEELSDDLDREMYHYAIQKLKSAGYKHYEISNASFPGFECRHNLKYWTLKEYLGFGPSASSYIDGTRFTVKADVEAYDTPVYEEYHVNSEFDNMSEFVFTGLRLTSGINYGEFRARFGIGFEETFAECMKELDEYVKSGDVRIYVDAEGNRTGIRLTEKGIDISNQILSLFV